jgi:UDP-N-acetylglucosamine acyltransferase
VHPGARLGPGVRVAPFAVVGDGVCLGEDVEIGPHAVLEGRLEVGARCQIFAGAAVGLPPQDLKWKPGTPSGVRIGEGTVVREYATIHRATTPDGWTVIGKDCYLMAQGHIAHDCQVGNHTVFANLATLAGHVHVGDYAILGGFTGVHQFVSIGAHSITGVSTVLLQDIPPYVMAAGNTAKPFGINSEGLKRRGFTPERIAAIKKAYKTLYRSGLSLEEARKEIGAQVAACPELQVMLDFLERSRRGIIR